MVRGSIFRAVARRSIDPSSDSLSDSSSEDEDSSSRRVGERLSGWRVVAAIFSDELVDDGFDETVDSRSESTSPDEVESNGKNDAGGRVEVGNDLRDAERISSLMTDCCLGEEALPFRNADWPRASAIRFG